MISNCVITDNHVGIAIDSYPPNPTRWLHSPIIVNNTIAWNKIGIWSGVLQVWPAGDRKGWARPRLLNNVIDSGDPDNQFPGAPTPNTSCFEGLDPDDLTIHKIGTTIVDIDFNAYEIARYNVGTTVNPPGWNPAIYFTAPRSSTPVYAPRVDIHPYTNTGDASKARMALYICDTFRIAEGASSNLTSRSPHDFRLTIHPRAALGDPLVLNPLVNKGVDTQLGTQTLRFKNFLNSTDTPDISEPPGLPGPRAQSQGGAADFASFHSADWGMEGYGNLRNAGRPDFPGPPLHSTNRDLGADEMANGLIMAGTINGTRICSRDVPGTSPNSPNNIQVYFFHRYYEGNAYPRPLYTQWTGRVYYGYMGSRHWWEYVQAQPPNVQPHPGPNPSTSFFTEGDDVSATQKTLRRFLVTLPASIWEHFMRNLECDFSPFLLPELHPFWGTWPVPLFYDIFGSNPWFHHDHSLALSCDNRYLYYNPAEGYAVLYGTINPPGSYLFNPTTGYLTGTPVQFGPFGSGGASTYSVNTWGFGDTGGTDLIPETGNWQGVRFTCQVFVNGVPKDNLQTLLGVNGVLPVDPPPLNSMAPKAELARPMSRLQIEQAIATAKNQVRNRLKKK
ncbi:MAG: hypothetical protein ACE5F1_03305 [Planctomycetota bacterium]